MLFRPCRACFNCHSYPGLAPWAAIWRRFAAGNHCGEAPAVHNNSGCKMLVRVKVAARTLAVRVTTFLAHWGFGSYGGFHDFSQAHRVRADVVSCSGSATLTRANHHGPAVINTWARNDWRQPSRRYAQRAVLEAGR